MDKTDARRRVEEAERAFEEDVTKHIRSGEWGRIFVKTAFDRAIAAFNAYAARIAELEEWRNNAYELHADDNKWARRLTARDQAVALVRRMAGKPCHCMTSGRALCCDRAEARDIAGRLDIGAALGGVTGRLDGK